MHLHGVEHQVNKPPHPRTNRQIEPINRTIKQAIIKDFDYASLKQLQEHMKYYLWAYNSARLLRSFKRQTPIGFILQRWHRQPQLFLTDPSLFSLGLNT
ncbi:integrase core domain-containing protein [Pseudomonas luteola]|uniref:integrase core domain-containing protein n=1 Tax=Pseudomonas luteola TaxID=47886 RepID=UPI000A06776E